MVMFSHFTRPFVQTSICLDGVGLGGLLDMVVLVQPILSLLTSKGREVIKRSLDF